jgi:hypothetical protein
MTGASGGGPSFVGGGREVALARIAEEEAEARRALRAAERWLEALAELRREVDALPQHVTPAALADRLRHDRALVEVRSRLLVEARDARDAAVTARMAAEPEAAGALAEIARAREVELGAVAVPDAVRHALRERADRARRRIAPLLALATRPAERLDAPDRAVRVAFACAPDTGNADALVLLLPVPYDVHAAPYGRGDDLCLRLACRAVGAVVSALSALGATDAPVRYVDVLGALGVQVWLGGTMEVGRVRQAASDALCVAFEAARELPIARLRVEVAEVPASALAGVLP